MSQFNDQRAERAFNFDIDEVDKAIQSGFTPVPKEALNDLTSFEKWLKGAR